MIMKCDILDMFYMYVWSQFWLCFNVLFCSEESQERSNNSAENSG